MANNKKGAVEVFVGELGEKFEEKQEAKTSLEKIEEKQEAKSSLEKLIKVSDETDDKSIKETAFEEGIQQLFTKDNLEMKTDLSPPLILAMSRGRIYQKYFHSKIMGDFIDNVMILSVSKGRKGRQELVALVRNSQETEFYGGGTDMSNFNKLVGK